MNDIIYSIDSEDERIIERLRLIIGDDNIPAVSFFSFYASNLDRLFSDLGFPENILVEEMFSLKLARSLSDKTESGGLIQVRPIRSHAAFIIRGLNYMKTVLDFHIKEFASHRESDELLIIVRRLIDRDLFIISRIYANDTDKQDLSDY